MRSALVIGGLAALILMAMVGIIVGSAPYNEQRVLEATAQMERLATKLEHAKTVAPETKFEIVRLIRRPWYDCNQVACRTALEMRNRAVRARLQTVLGASTAELAARVKQESITINVRH